MVPGLGGGGGRGVRGHECRRGRDRRLDGLRDGLDPRCLIRNRRGCGSFAIVASRRGASSGVVDRRDDGVLKLDGSTRGGHRRHEDGGQVIDPDRDSARRRRGAASTQKGQTTAAGGAASGSA